MDDALRANRAIWDAWTVRVVDSEHARDAARVRAGGSSIRPIERTELGNVADLSLLHLLCNQGADSVSWARLGARVTGVDFSSEAIARAQALAAETHQPARFICSDLYALPAQLDEQFDIVYCAYGVLCWLPNLAGWAATIARYVRPGGICYLIDMHPYAGFLTPDHTAPAGVRLNPAFPYFHDETPRREHVSIPDPAGGGATPASLAVWDYSLGDVVSALAAAGLRIEFLHEHPMSFYRQFPTLKDGGDGLWRWPDTTVRFPLLFSLCARKGF